MKARTNLIAVTSCAAALILVHVFATNSEAAPRTTSGDKEKIHSEAYGAVVRAEQARGEKKHEEMLDYFAAALTSYRQLAKQYPDFHPRIVEHQIAYCINEIRSLLEWGDLKARYGAKLKPLLNEPVPHRIPAAGVASTAAAQNADGEKDLVSAEEMKMEIGILRAELVSLTSQLAESEGQKGTGAAGRDASSAALEKELKSTRQRYEKAVAEKESLEKDLALQQKAREKAAKENETLNRKVRDLEKENRKLQKDKKDLERRAAKAGKTGTAEGSHGEAADGGAGAGGPESPASGGDSSGVGPVAAAGRGAAGSGVVADAVRLMREGSLDKAGELIRSGLEKTPEDANLLLMSGILDCRQGRFEEAVKTLAPLVSAEPTNTKARVALGVAYIQLERFSDANLELEAALAFEPDSREAHYNLAQLLLLTTPRDAERAGEHYREALKFGAQRDAALEAELEKVPVDASSGK